VFEIDFLVWLQLLHRLVAVLIIIIIINYLTFSMFVVT